MKLLQRTIPIIFGIIFTYIITLIIFFSNINYAGKEKFLLPNFLIILFVGIVVLLCYFIPKQKDIKTKNYYKILIAVFIITYIIQILIQLYGVFKTGWDAGLVNNNADYFIKNNRLLNIDYMTRYPNNIMITFIIVLLKQISIPLIGERLAFLLGINSLLVNLSCLFLSLTIKNISNNKRLALYSYLISIPLIILSPWIIIVYTDTFAILFPILMIYIYTKKNKRTMDFFLIIFLGFFGMYIKPTVIIVLIAIFIVELFNKRIFVKNIKKMAIYILMIIVAVSVVLLTNRGAKAYLKFEPKKDVYEFTLVHYLAMGQNDKTTGAFSSEDMWYSINNGMDKNYNRFEKRLLKRNLVEQIEFFSKKMLANYNNGSFAWSREGDFYKEIKPASNKNIVFVRNIYYKEGKYNELFFQIVQYIWLFVLLFIPFIIKKENSKEELVLMLSIIGITLFLTIFEARARYLYCYSPVFVVTAMLGISRLKQAIYDIKKKSKKKRAH